ncbi:hypothetical protein HYC85_010933 [Camellia sinensis]|uniref:Uncharacterized protein n=1 Tax=Camellia sinensis TaxID=4442 RepID=A0A7J7HJU1_CAMSI|nr:hypothetical protein HYC85_010933 [Camellia sinensis]
MELMDKLKLGNEEEHENEVGFSQLVRKKSWDRRKGDYDEGTQVGRPVGQPAGRLVGPPPT